MKDKIGLYTKVVDVLVVQPAFLFVFAVLLLFTGGGTVSFVSGVVTGSTVQIAAGTLVALASLLLTFATVYRVQGDPIRRGSRVLLLKELQRLKTSLEQSFLVKSDLTITLFFQSVDQDAHGHMTSRLKLSTAFKIENTSESPIEFPVTAQIEPSRFTAAPVRGVLRAVDTANSLEVFKEDFDFHPTPDPRGLTYLHKTQITIRENSSLKVKWSAIYDVDLPYAEFWASADPIEGLRMIVEIFPKISLAARADVYRHLVATHQFTSTPTVTGHDFNAEGPFLPYQGVFLRVFLPAV